MNTNNYTPNPIDTSHVVLSDDLLQLAERMAENVHEVWAATRIAQGWVYDPNTDEDSRHHPDYAKPLKKNKDLFIQNDIRP